MTKAKNKSEVIEEILKELRREVEQFIEVEDQITTGLEYERRVIQITRSMGKKLMQGRKDIEALGKNSKKKL